MCCRFVRRPLVPIPRLHGQNDRSNQRDASKLVERRPHKHDGRGVHGFRSNLRERARGLGQRPLERVHQHDHAQQRFA